MSREGGRAMRTSRRQFLQISALGVAGAAALAACGGAAAPPTAVPTPALVPTLVPKAAEAKPAAATGQSVKLSLWHNWGNNPNEGGSQANIELIEAFEKANPGVKIDNVFDANWDKILTALAGGTPPDTFVLGAEQLPSLADRGAILNLDPYLQSDKIDMNRFFDFVRRQTSFGGHYYAITHHPDIRLLWRSADAFRDAKLDPEKEPKTWDDLVSFAKAMTKKDGARFTRMGFVPNWTSSQWLPQYIQMNGARILSEDGKKVAFNAPEGVAATEWLLKALDDLYGGAKTVLEFQQANTFPQGQGVYGGFPHDTLGMAFYGNWLADAVEMDKPKMEVLTGMFPGGPAQAGKQFIVGGGTMNSIPTDAKQKDWAWKFLAMQASDDGGYMVQRIGNDVSGIVAAANDSRIVPKKLNRDKILPLFQKANILHYAESPISDQITEAFKRTGDAILLKQDTPKALLDKTAADVQKALDEYYSKKK
jgi:multiple sugar transport system substrate-binding protein